MIVSFVGSLTNSEFHSSRLKQLRAFKVLPGDYTYASRTFTPPRRIPPPTNVEVPTGVFTSARPQHREQELCFFIIARTALCGNPNCTSSVLPRRGMILTLTLSNRNSNTPVSRLAPTLPSPHHPRLRLLGFRFAAD